MKKFFLLAAVLGVSAASVFLLVRNFPFSAKKQTVYIALAGPMSGNEKENGEAMMQGVNMCLDAIRDRGSFKDKNIELLVYNDKDKRTAISIASQIADEAKALLVIGHYDSDGSAAAGAIYRKNGIPAITASATAESVTADNEWYFRVIPDNRCIKSFIACGVKKLLGSSSASIIYENSTYGTSLASGFEEQAGKLGISVINKWGFDSTSEHLDHELRHIVGDLRAAEKTGTIFCATHSTEGVKFFASCRYPGTDYTVVGPDSFATPAFISQFNAYPREQEKPGYYTDGIYAVSPFISYLADEENARTFRQKFVSLHGREPSWVAACYYDAMQVALAAVEKAEILGQDIREDRRRVRNALAGINEPDIAVKGVSGDIYFDKERNVSRALGIGVWDRHLFIPIYSQFQGVLPNPLPNEDSEKVNPEPVDKEKEKQETGKDQTGSEAQSITYFRIVYTGLYINEISRADTEKGTFTADFYLWFRFRGNFDDTRIRFVNAVNPVHLEKPVKEEHDRNVTVRAYRITADFKADCDTKAFPLDQHILRISFSHEQQSRKEMVYVPDMAGISLRAGKVDREKMMLNPISGWNTTDISYFQDIAQTPGTGKNMVSHSRFNTEIRIQRQNRMSVLLKYGFPMAVSVIFLYFIFLIPPDLPQIRMVLLIAVMLTVLGMRIVSGYFLPEPGLIGNMFPPLYLLTGFCVILSAAVHLVQKRNAGEKVMFFNRMGKALYVFLALSGGGFFAYSCWLAFFLKP